MRADLHIHSTVSDGSLTMEEIARRAVEKGLDLIAVTDHDTTAHFGKLPEQKGLLVIGGIEISAFDRQRNTKAHILGYGIKRPEQLEKTVHPVLQARHENCMRQVEILQEHGYSIDLEDMYRADGTYLYKQHIMEYLVRTGQAEEMFGEFYQKTFKNGGICDFDIEYLEPETAVLAIREAGGLPVLAHSGQQQNFELIPGLVECGLAGLEYNHPANGSRDKEIIRIYAKKFGLFLTGGSDFHGAYEKKSADIGDFLSEESGISAILNAG